MVRHNASPISLPTTAPSASLAEDSLNIGRFRNWKMMAFELAVALLGFGAFAVATIGNGSPLGIVCAMAGIGALWLFQCELLGISIDSRTLTIPSKQIPWMPALSFRRRRVLLSEVRRLTLSPRRAGFEVAKISGGFGWNLLVFASTDQRRRFIALFESLCPGVEVYRIRSPADPSPPPRLYTWLGDQTALGLIPDRQEPPELPSNRDQ
jgi:hypothetical protein